MASIGFMAIAALVLVTCLGIPLAFGVALIGIVGISLVMGITQAGVQAYQITFTLTTEFVLTSIPLFIFMGQLVSIGMLGRDIYDCVQKWMGWLPGGLAVATVTSCAALGAVTGISVAGIGALGPIALPAMRRHGYDNRLSAGSLASASTLAIMIPPSVSFIVYGIWTETSIGKLFIGGIIPGIIMTLVFCTYIVAVSIRHPARAPRGPSYPLRVKVKSLMDVLPIAVIFVLMMSGLYLGWFTASEGAAVGCSAVALVLFFMGRLTWSKVVQAAIETASLSVMLFAVLIATQIFSRFLVLTDVQRVLVALITEPGFNRYFIIALIMTLYLLLGMIMDGISMMLITLPFVFPVAKQLGFDPVWFGIVLTVMIEIGLVTPPIGLNCYMLNKVEPAIPLDDVFRGVLPFVFLCLGCVVLFTIFPALVTWLPEQAFVR